MPLEYFAYGSNMHPARLRERIGPAIFVAVAAAPGYRLVFHKRGRDGSGKCDILRTDHRADRVHGVVFRIDREQKTKLDAFEGVGRGYVETELTVRTAADERRVHSYTAQPGYTDPALAPYDWYKALVLEAARLHAFPTDYLSAIERTADLPDPDSRRALHHRRLLAATQGRASNSSADTV